MVKESIFNIIVHSYNNRFDIENSNILDIYSGSSFGLECLSRGAKEIVFIENYSEVINILKKNIEILNGKRKCKIIEEDCFNFIKNKNFSLKFDLIFIDPPFKDTQINSLVLLIKEKNILDKNGIIIIHRHINDKIDISKSVKILDERTYGISKVMFCC